MTNQVDVLHSQAMIIADNAFIARRKGLYEQAKQLSNEAFKYERDAALLLLNQIEIEPTRSVLFRSAGWLAFNAQEYEQAKIMVDYGLQGNPPVEIKEELNELFQELQKIKFSEKTVNLDKSKLNVLPINIFDIPEINSSEAFNMLRH